MSNTAVRVSDKTSGVSPTLDQASLIRPLAIESFGDKQWNELVDAVRKLERHGLLKRAGSRLNDALLSDEATSPEFKNAAVGFLLSSRDSYSIRLYTLRTDFRKAMKRNHNVFARVIKQGLAQLDAQQDLVRQSKSDRTKQLPSLKLLENRRASLVQALDDLLVSAPKRSMAEYVNLVPEDGYSISTLLNGMRNFYNMPEDALRTGLGKVRQYLLSSQLKINNRPLDFKDLEGQAAASNQFSYRRLVNQLCIDQNPRIRAIGANEAEFFVMRFPNQILDLSFDSIQRIKDPSIKAHVLWHRLEQDYKETKIGDTILTKSAFEDWEDYQRAHSAWMSVIRVMDESAVKATASKLFSQRDLLEAELRANREFFSRNI